jgi:hypothetical protein
MEVFSAGSVFTMFLVPSPRKYKKNAYRVWLPDQPSEKTQISVT